MFIECCLNVKRYKFACCIWSEMPSTSVGPTCLLGLPSIYTSVKKSGACSRRDCSISFPLTSVVATLLCGSPRRYSLVCETWRALASRVYLCGLYRGGRVLSVQFGTRVAKSTEWTEWFYLCSFSFCYHSLTLNEMRRAMKTWISNPAFCWLGGIPR
jgi:hypothetical protein